MPDDFPRRIILEKSSTVRRRYQRSNKRFQFTPTQLAKIEREEKAIARAKDLREKEKQRLAKKKQKAEKEAKAREERKRLGLPDPNARKVPSSQPLLLNFFGGKSPAREAPKEESPKEEPPKEAAPLEDSPKEESPKQESLPTDLTATTTKTGEHDGGDMETNSAGGDTEIDSDFDDLDEEMEKEFANLDDLRPLEESGTHNANDNCKESLLSAQDDDDEFSDCSAFDDEEIMKEAEAVANMRSAQKPPTINESPSNNPALLQPPKLPHKGRASPIASLGDSFRDDTADYLENVFARGCGESFSELIGL
ncbi:uncharacterized protein N7477_000764 [Penicillium maclennaniae]|uniref:uncharacterized protein n=1 Tax=Penicillium maclennaniae TaxID=1343394 RepID=UPI0025401E1C|nr:uncharacterized protein N7477_000764 [Penicillium maclennaniae]KAJ5684419.1 hypothetical protein N7477_000764 [Penicillium maclennaniae]